jgi:cell division protein FtsQ
VLTGDVPSFAEAIADTLRLEVFTLAKALHNHDFLGALIEQIDLRKGEYTLVPKIGSAEVLLGDLTDLDFKLHKLDAYFRGVVPEIGWDAYSEVDLRFGKQVIGTHNDNYKRVALAR